MKLIIGFICVFLIGIYIGLYNGINYICNKFKKLDNINYKNIMEKWIEQGFKL